MIPELHRLEAGSRSLEARRREEEERVNLETVEYEAFERAFLSDPGHGIGCLDGPLHGRVMAPRACDCRVCEGSHDTWPVRWRYDRSDPGEYVLAYVWASEGVEHETVWPNESGEYWAAGLEEDAE